MFVPYSEIHSDAKVWIYQSDKEINEQDQIHIKKQLKAFCHSWNAHGKPLKCSYQMDNWFISLFVDEQQSIASGCSIDSSVSVIKSIEKEFNLNFFNRLNIAFKDGDITKVLSLKDFIPIISPKLRVYNNLVKNKYEFENERIISIENSWLAKYL